jgi:hypothetical protein
MVHPRVVRLFDVFEIDSNSFATVLEYCRGATHMNMTESNTTLTESNTTLFGVYMYEAPPQTADTPCPDPHTGNKAVYAGRGM